MSLPTKKPRLLTLMALAAISVITVNLFLPAIPQIAEAFNVSKATMTWALSGYMIATGVLQFVLGPLSDRIGRRPVMLACLSIFLIASFIAAIAPTLQLFFIARFTQAAVVGAMILSQAAVRDISGSSNEAAEKLATVAMVMSLGPMFAPLTGGVLSVAFGWRSNFWFLGLLGSLLLAVALFNFHETNQNLGQKTNQQSKDYWDLVKNKVFWGYCLSNSFSVGMFFVFITSVPIIAKELGFSTLVVAVVLAALPLGYFAGNMVVRAKSSTWGLARLILYGRMLAILAPIFSYLIYVLGASTLWAMAPLVLVGMANGLSVPTSNAGCLSVNPKIAGSAAGLNAFVVIAWGVIFTIIAGYLLDTIPDLRLLLLGMWLVAVMGVWPAWVVWQNRDKSNSL